MHQNFLSHLSSSITSSYVIFTAQALSYICEAVTRASCLFHKVKRKAGVRIIELYRKKNKLFFKCFSVCVEFVCVWEHICAHMWKQKKVSSSLWFSLFYSPEKISLTEPRACHFSARLAANKPHGSSCLHLPQCCDYRCTCPCLAFYVIGCRVPKYRSSCLYSKCSLLLNIFSSLVLFVLLLYY